MTEVLTNIWNKDFDPTSDVAHLTNEEISVLLVVLFAAWCFVGYLHTYIPFERLGMDKGQKADSQNRVVSIYHGLISLALSSYYLYCNGLSGIRYGQECNVFEALTLINTTSYFLYDLTGLYLTNILDTFCVIHHGMCVIAMFACLYAKNGSGEIVGCIFVSEGSNPCMHMRVLLQHVNLRYTKLYERLEYAFMLLYVWGRVYIGTSINYNGVMHPDSHILIKLGGTGVSI